MFYGFVLISKWTIDGLKLRNCGNSKCVLKMLSLFFSRNSTSGFFCPFFFFIFFKPIQTAALVEALLTCRQSQCFTQCNFFPAVDTKLTLNSQKSDSFCDLEVTFTLILVRPRRTRVALPTWVAKGTNSRLRIPKSMGRPCTEAALQSRTMEDFPPRRRRGQKSLCLRVLTQGGYSIAEQALVRWSCNAQQCVCVRSTSLVWPPPGPVYCWHFEHIHCLSCLLKCLFII